MSEWWTKQDVAKEFGVSTRTVQKWIVDGGLPVYRNGKILRIKKTDAENFLVKHGSSAGDDPIQGGSDLVTIAFSPDGRHLACGLADGKINVWDLESGKLVRTLSYNPTPNDSEDAEKMATLSAL